MHESSVQGVSAVNERIAERVREKEKRHALARIALLSDERRRITSQLARQVRLAKKCGATDDEVAAAGEPS